MHWIAIILAVVHGYQNNTRTAFYVIQAIGVAIALITAGIVHNQRANAGLPTQPLVTIPVTVAASLLLVFAAHYLGRWLGTRFRRAQSK